MLKKNPFPSNETRMFIHLSERINPFPTHTLEHIPLDELAKFQFPQSNIQIVNPYDLGRPLLIEGLHLILAGDGDI